MKIIIDCRTTYNSDRALSIFTGEFLQEMVSLKYDHDFILLTGGKNVPVLPAKNAIVHKLKRTGIKWFDQKKLDRAVVAWRADRFVSIRENGFCIRHLPRKKETNKIAAQPDRLLLFSGNGQAQPLLKKALPVPVISIVQPACPAVITTLSWTAAESIKTQYTGGRSFFLFTGNISAEHQLMELLKAFSIFKKWQQSNMQLVIAGYATAFTKLFEEKLATYKYRPDVVLLKNIASAELAKLAAASYAMVYPVTGNAFPAALLWAVQSHKAIIASDSSVNRQTTTAAEWIDKENTAAGFAKAMILLYKDEKHQQLLVQQAIEAARQFNRGQMLAEVWQCIEK